MCVFVVGLAVYMFAWLCDCLRVLVVGLHLHVAVCVCALCLCLCVVVCGGVFV